MELKSSGEKREFKTGSVRDSAVGKARIDLIPRSTLIKLGIHYANGAEHYGDNNWKKGQPISSYMASFERHYNQFKQGITDENHLISAIWNLIAIDYTIDAIKAGLLPSDLDDRSEDEKENNPMSKLIQNVIKENIESKKSKTNKIKEITKSMPTWEEKLKQLPNQTNANFMAIEIYDNKYNTPPKFLHNSIMPKDVCDFVKQRIDEYKNESKHIFIYENKFNTLGPFVCIYAYPNINGEIECKQIILDDFDPFNLTKNKAINGKKIIFAVVFYMKVIKNLE